MDRSIPVSSKLVYQRKKERDDEILYNKLKNIQNGHSQYSYQMKEKKVQAGNSASHQNVLKKKNNFIVEMRKMDIERENHILSNKIKETEFRVGGLTPGYKVKKPGDFKDKASTGSSVQQHKRKEQQNKIHIENIYHFHRIDNQKSSYRLENFNDHNLRRKEVLGLRCEYPVIIEKNFGISRTDKNVRFLVTLEKRIQKRRAPLWKQAFFCRRNIE